MIIMVSVNKSAMIGPCNVNLQKSKARHRQHTQAFRHIPPNQKLQPKHKCLMVSFSTFTPAEILECCDPVAFAIGLVEHEDYLAELENE